MSTMVLAVVDRTKRKQRTAGMTPTVLNKDVLFLTLKEMRSNNAVVLVVSHRVAMPKAFLVVSHRVAMSTVVLVVSHMVLVSKEILVELYREILVELLREMLVGLKPAMDKAALVEVHIARLVHRVNLVELRYSNNKVLLLM